jgi:hypothetical protein
MKLIPQGGAARSAVHLIAAWRVPFALILSTIHSAKGQEWDAVFVINVADGCIPSDKVILVEMRRLRLGAGGVGRIEGQLGKEALAGVVARRDLLELVQVGTAGAGIVIDPLEVWLIRASARARSSRRSGASSMSR